jgi:hypothetical protein
VPRESVIDVGVITYRHRKKNTVYAFLYIQNMLKCWHVLSFCEGWFMSKVSMFVLVLTTVMLAGCSAPKPPSCDGSKLRPANPTLYPEAAKSREAAASYKCY